MSSLPLFSQLQLNARVRHKNTSELGKVVSIVVDPTGFSFCKIQWEKAIHPTIYDATDVNNLLELAFSFDEYIVPVIPTAPPVEKKLTPDMEFFSKVPEGYCKCGIPRLSCEYHK
jgi:hypothetical protein